MCAISFLEHFAARPSYRPSFRSRWYISLFGALTCLFMMLQMDPVYAVLAILMMVGLYQWLRRQKGREADDIAAMFEFSVHDDSSVVTDTVECCLFAASARMGLLVLRHGDLHFGERRTIHLWLTWNDTNNANMMILLSYILVGHEDCGCQRLNGAACC